MSTSLELLQNQASFVDLDAEKNRYRPIIFDLSVQEDMEAFEELMKINRLWGIHDQIETQLTDLAKSRSPHKKLTSLELELEVAKIVRDVRVNQYGRWVYFPWSGRLVHLLPPEEFHELRLDRNRNKITYEEQKQLGNVTVGIVGLSVGNAAALTMALEGVFGHIKLADFDTLDLSNMNRIRAGVYDLGIPKTVLAARQIYEINPYANITLYNQGVTLDNIDQFLSGTPKVDILIDECDSISLKFLLREKARELKLPVLMETSDRGMLDVERFDLEPSRPLFHGLCGNLTSKDIHVCDNETKIEAALSIIGTDTISSRSAASMIEIEQTISTWPQLASDVILGGSSLTAAVRRIGLGNRLLSGRRYVDLDNFLDQGGVQTPEPSYPAQMPERGLAQPSKKEEFIPELIRFFVNHAVLAPSGGNCQPWQFCYQHDKLHIIHDRKRSKNLLDTTNHGSYIALGAAIENIVIAARFRQYDSKVNLFPFDENRDIAASIEFAPFQDIYPEPEESLYHEISKRVTNRHVDSTDLITENELDRLNEALMSDNSKLHLVTDKQVMCEIADLLGQGDRIRFLNPELHREMMGEIRWNDKQTLETYYGIDLKTLEMTSAQAAGMRLLARPEVANILYQMNGGKALEKGAKDSIAYSSAVGLISMIGRQNEDWIKAGRQIQRLWLTATKLGLAFQPMTALLFMFDLLHQGSNTLFSAIEKADLMNLHSDLYRLFNLPPDMTPVMLFRIAKADEVTIRSLRLPVDWVLTKELPSIQEVRV
ncbi:Rv1355c family protein [Paenibacillus filicis]|uniref:Rv1355c family protein n=1 Tax=Paenibacillus gyeongsangnamensis TaxID=3388067 RepID=A0ABT4QJ34_9BACL|nr:Rv1355c family protein [Paenibacillus filicis]MCZ8516860.1 Rv1355c family protein [Paenibacillus filicis]